MGQMQSQPCGFMEQCYDSCGSATQPCPLKQGQMRGRKPFSGPDAITAMRIYGAML